VHTCGNILIWKILYHNHDMENYITIIDISIILHITNEYSESLAYWWGNAAINYLYSGSNIISSTRSSLSFMSSNLACNESSILFWFWPGWIIKRHVILSLIIGSFIVCSYFDFILLSLIILQSWFQCGVQLCISSCWERPIK